MKAFQVELKVCEACGVLWLRAAGHGVYCRSCTAWLSEFPPAVRPRRQVSTAPRRQSRVRAGLATNGLLLGCRGGNR